MVFGGCFHNSKNPSAKFLSVPESKHFLEITFLEILFLLVMREVEWDRIVKQNIRISYKNYLSGPSFSFEGSKFAFRYFPKQAFIIIGIFIGIWKWKWSQRAKKYFEGKESLHSIKIKILIFFLSYHNLA